MKSTDYAFLMLLGACGGIRLDADRAAPNGDFAGKGGTAGNSGTAASSGFGAGGAGTGSNIVTLPAPVATGAGGNGTPAIGGSGSGGTLPGMINVPMAGRPEIPEYSRTCIEGRLARLGAGGAADDGGAPSAGAPNSPPGGADESNGAPVLGAGDLTMLVVFDKSGSMGDNWNDGSSEMVAANTKWTTANNVFMEAIADTIDNLTIGTIFFPMPGDCNVALLDSGLQIDFMPGRPFRDHWQETAAGRSPNGATPLELSFRVADMGIERGCGLGLLDDRFRVVLVSDGQPSCSDDTTNVVAMAAEWNRLGVETWVMGLPGSQAELALLDEIAAAGGTEKAQLLGTPAALRDGLAEAAK